METGHSHCKMACRKAPVTHVLNTDDDQGEDDQVDHQEKADDETPPGDRVTVGKGKLLELGPFNLHSEWKEAGQVAPPEHRAEAFKTHRSGVSEWLTDGLKRSIVRVSKHASVTRPYNVTRRSISFYKSIEPFAGARKCVSNFVSRIDDGSLWLGSLSRTVVEWKRKEVTFHTTIFYFLIANVHLMQFAKKFW